MDYAAGVIVIVCLTVAAVVWLLTEKGDWPNDDHREPPRGGGPI